MSTCSRCGAALGAADTYFDKTGAICCARCERVSEIGQLSPGDGKEMEALSRAHDRNSMLMRIVGGLIVVAIVVVGVFFFRQGVTHAAECAPCKADSDCSSGLKCMEFGSKIENKTKMCGTPESNKCKP